MDGNSWASLAGIAFLMLCSAYFSATETAFSSFNRIRMKSMAEKGSKRTALVLKLYEEYDKLLATILIGNNVVNIAAASIATVLFVRVFAGNGTWISILVTTLATLLFAEISPKILAKESPEKFAMFSAPMLRVLLVVFTPVNFFFTQWKKLLSRLFKASEDQAITEEELMTIIEEAEHDGAINEEDKQLIHSVIDFNDSRVVDILTPRVDIIGVMKGASIKKITEAFIQTGYSRIPVFAGTIDNIIGIIHIRDFFELTLKNKALEEIITPAVFTTPYVKISDLLKKLQIQKCHLAVVTDEYGGTVGIVTMEDILEELVGEIWDEHDEILENVTQLADGSHKITCSAGIDELLELFELNDDIAAPTVSGWVLEQLGAIPKEGDTFVYEGLFVTVSKADSRRAIEIIVAKTEGEAEVLPDAEK